MDAVATEMRSVGIDDFGRQKALYSAGLWFITSYGLGTLLGSRPSLKECAIDGAIMGASALASDAVLYVSNVRGEQTLTMSAPITGLFFAGAQKMVRGSDSYIMNFAMATGNDLFMDMGGFILFTMLGGGKLH